ncbi:MAG TPA: hypothetical protein VLA89_19790 [Gemmatimonadales bacterium]|nr:hypothetical protein [Gemmatimonadales bacterium]
MLRAVRTGSWLFTLAIAAYVLLDFSSPQVLGAFVFDVDRSVDVVVPSGHGFRLDGSSAVVTPPPDPVRAGEVKIAPPAQARIAAPAQWFVALRKAHCGSSERSVLADSD